MFFLSFRRNLIIVALLVPLLCGGAGWGAGASRQDDLEALSPGERYSSFMNGVRISCWDTNQRICVLEMMRLELTPKRWGPFKFADSKDVLALDCRLQVDASALALSLQEIGSTLLQLANMRNAKHSHGEIHPEPDLGKPAYQSLIVLPPKLKASPFWCRLNYPHGQGLILRADLAALDPQQHLINLQGRVKVVSDQGACLLAEDMNWEVSTQRLQVGGQYTFQWGERTLKGRDGGFSLAGGKLKRTKFVKEMPTCGELPSSVMPSNLLATAFAGKKLSGMGDTAMLMFLALMQAQAGSGESLEMKNLPRTPFAPPSQSPSLKN
jgi:hypothetical protein